MKTNPYLTICLMSFLVVRAFTGDARAQDLNVTTGTTVHASEVFQPDINQGTNVAVAARRVTWENKSWSAIVFFSKNNDEAVVAQSTNEVCFLHGKLFAVFPGVQEFWIRTSEAVETNDLTSEVAIRLAEQRVHEAGFGPGYRHVDLRSLLKQEQERRLAQMLILRSIDIRAERGQLVVSFESHTGLHGTAVLNDDLQLVSATLE